MTDARTLTSTLGGKWHGHYGAVPCPVCQPEGRKGQDGLTLTDGASGLLAHCKKSGCTFRDILAAAGIAPGTHTPPDPHARLEAERQRKAEADKRAGQALRLWQDAKPIAGTIAETYLRDARGVTCPLPDTLRFAPSCWHATAQRFPAMVALVEGGTGFAVHRTYLCADGCGKAKVDPPKAMLGAVGGGAVRLTRTAGPLMAAEGIETALSLASGRVTAPETIWAALSTSGIRALHLPPKPGRLTIASDGDAAGREAAHTLATRADGLGWQVSLLPAPEGLDWNDVLQGKAGAA